MAVYEWTFGGSAAAYHFVIAIDSETKLITVESFKGSFDLNALWFSDGKSGAVEDASTTLSGAFSSLNMNGSVSTGIVWDDVAILSRTGLGSAALVDVMNAQGAPVDSTATGVNKATFITQGETVVLDGSDIIANFAMADWASMILGVRATSLNGSGSLKDVDATANALVIASDEATVLEDGSVSGNVLTNDEARTGATLKVVEFAVAGFPPKAVDADGESFTIPNVGTLTMKANGDYSFVPAPNYAGPVPTITYKAADADTGLIVGTATLTFDITAVNDAPSGTDATITMLEDGTRVLTAADFGFSDALDGNSLQAVKITTLPTAGTLTLDGQAVAAGAFVSVADIAAGKLVFAPAANANGTGYASLTFQVQDNGGTANSGIDLDPTANTLTFDVTAVNDAPSGTDATITMLEDGTRVLTAADFGFSDALDGNSLQAVRITTLPTAGTLTLDGQAVAAGAFVSVADINAGKLVFAPAANANGTGYASLTFQVQDDGGTANSGIDLDPTANTLTFDVTAVNDAPSGTDATITMLEDGTRVLTAADFGFSDALDGNSLQAVKITTLPTAGTLTLNGQAVAAGALVSAADIAAGKLAFAPAANANGTGYASLTFQVQDNGGTANSGIDLDPTANTLTFDVTAVNDAPSGTDATITMLEDGTRVLTAADFGFSDALDGNSLQAVKITTLPTAGTLTLDGQAVAAGAFVSVADIAAGKLVFAPAANANGTGYASLTFQVQDNGGTANSGIDLDPTANTLTFDVTAVNDAPSGTDATITMLEDGTRVLTAADFGFSDALDGNSLQAVRITTLPTAGTLTLDGQAVAAGAFVSVADINAGKLVFAPAANANGTGYASLTFQVQDDGGTANSGIDLDPTANTLTFDVTAVNDAPSGTDATITMLEDGTRVLTAADFGFSDALDGNSLQAVKITTLPTAGTLTLNGQAVAAGALVSAADINAGKLVFAPAANANGTGYASLTFQVQDDGGTANSGIDLDPTANTLTFNVTAVNDAPSGTDATITMLEDGTRVLTAADFGFSDALDGNSLQAVKITTLPTAGTLTLDGQAVAAGAFVSVADIAAGKLVFAPAANANGTGYASLTFQVQDNGGTANSGIDLDPTANTLTFDVTAVNDAPSGTDATITMLEDGTRVLTAADFGFSDALDGNSLQAVKITTLPTAGTLTLDGQAVAAGAFVSVADINAGKLVFAPAANANGTGYASLTFQVQDNGGTANSGIDLDPTANTLTFNVTAVNDAPVISGLLSTIAVAENSPGVVLDTFTVTDVDTLTGLSFRVLLGSSVDTRFEVVAASGTMSGAPGDYVLRLKSGTFLDFEAENADSNPTIALTIEVNDGASTNSLATASTTITVTDVPEQVLQTMTFDTGVIRTSVVQNTQRPTSYEEDGLRLRTIGGSDELNISSHFLGDADNEARVLHQEESPLRFEKIDGSTFSLTSVFVHSGNATWTGFNSANQEVATQTVSTTGLVSFSSAFTNISYVVWTAAVQAGAGSQVIDDLVWG